ncbi:MAG: tRNA (pseudouridine(54)-N(1))-methyltransferase TrmY [Methanocellales archaeon]
MSREFLVIGHKAVTTSDFSLNDLPSSGGRMDILCRCVNAALFLSHSLRKDVRIHLLLLGPPDPPVKITFNCNLVKYLNPDERSAGSLIQKALKHRVGESTPGVFISKQNLEEIIEGKNLIYLHPEGEDIRNIEIIENTMFILGDHLGLTQQEEELLEKMQAKKVSVGPEKYHAEHCIVIVHNELDRREKWKRK